MKSTNGSTLLIKEDDYLKLKGEMNFKLEDISFKIKEVEDIEKWNEINFFNNFFHEIFYGSIYFNLDVNILKIQA